MRRRLSAAGNLLFVLHNRYADAFARGLLAAIILVFAALFLLDPSSLLHRYFQTDRPVSDSAYVARKIYGDGAARSYDIVVVGGSSMREMIPPPRGEAMARPDLCPHRDRLLNAATSSQQPVDAYAIADAVAPPYGLLVVGLSGRRLISDRRNDPYALQSQSVELPRSYAAMLDALSHGRIEFLSLDFFDQFRRSHQAFRTAFRASPGKRPPGDGELDNRSAYPEQPLPVGDKQLIADKLLLTAELPNEGSSRSIAGYWLDFANHATRSGWKVLFVFTPTSAEADGYGAYTKPTVDIALSHIQTLYPVLDLREGQQSYVQADFYDPIHVSHSGRDKLWPRLAAAIRDAQACHAGEEERS